jgi:hypothetical protein
MRPYREIAALAGLQVLCFLLLSHLEPSFFLLHFYQTIVYLAILIMLFYREDRWESGRAPGDGSGSTQVWAKPL